MLKTVVQTISKYNMICPGQRIVVGVSGGADSVALLLMLVEYQNKVDFDIIVVHVNHLIREDAGEDARFVEELCKTLGVECHIHEVDVSARAASMHMSVEEAGRVIRYEIMRSYSPDRIAVAHHEDDLAETVLLNMCRGTGLHGMTGIAPVEGDIIRPFLYITRKKIEEYLASINQNYRTDSTNQSTDYARNKIRLNVMPMLSDGINVQTSSHIAHMAGDMLELEEYVEEAVSEAYDQICRDDSDESITIDKTAFSKLHPYIGRELLLKVIEQLTPRRKDITREHIAAILEIAKLDGSKKCDLPYGLEAVSIYDTIVIRKHKIVKNNEFDIELTEDMISSNAQISLSDGKILAVSFCLVSDVSIEHNQYTKYIDYDKINSCIRLRSRAEGDYLTINSRMQRKALKEYMINEKIPKEERDNLPIIADGEHVIWVIGYRISEAYKVTPDTKKVVEIKITSN